MTIKISSIRAARDEEWDDIWWQCEYATFFHSREWAEIWHHFTQGNTHPYPRLVIFNDGKKALLPLSCQRRFKNLLKYYESSPAENYGGWISADNLSEAHCILLDDYWSKKLRNLVWRLNPFNEYSFKSAKPAGREDETYVLHLEKGFDDLFKNHRQKGSNAILRKARKAQDAGILIKSASTLTEWGSYFNVYQDSLRRWGDHASSSYPWALFQYLSGRNSSHIKLWLAEYQKEAIAGSLCFYSRQHVVYWHGAGMKAYFHLRPVNLLMLEIIKNACEKDFKWFDFNPSGGHEGVRKFKQSFGTTELHCPVINSVSRMYRLFSFLSQQYRKSGRGQN
jgi:hypothetical protein